MSGSEVLQESENSALVNNQIVSNVVGKKTKVKGVGNLKGISALGFVVVMIVVFAVIFNSGTLIPSAISERLIEETDVQYADAVESKKIVFQQALMDGEIPENTAEILGKNGVLVGYMDNGEFKEGNKHSGGLVLKQGDKIITPENFINETNNNIELYNALDSATYKRAAYYYDEAAEEVFKKIGTSRNNFTSESDFDEVMDEKMKSGSDISVNSVHSADNEEGLEENGTSASSGKDAEEFVEEVRQKNPAGSATESAINTADALKVADTTAKEQRSALFFSLFMENISKMKAGEGNEAKINEAMNFLYDEAETEVVDVNTGEIVKTRGTPLDSPSLYAVLANEKVDPSNVENYSSDRILRTIENRSNTSGNGVMNGTVASTTSGVKGSIGRMITDGIEVASSALVNLVTPTVSSSLVDNSFDTIKGVKAGEFLVEGAVNTGKMLAKASGATAGDAEAVVEYARLNNEILAMDAKVDRMNRSPFDITSKNTFLGSIVYNFSVALNKAGGGIMAKSTAVFGNIGKAVGSLTTGVYADSTDGYLTNFGVCETIGSIGAVGSPQCSESATFDTSTLNDPFHDSGFMKFVEENTTLSGGTRTIDEDSILARFIIYNNNRVTPIGVMDGGILDSLSNGSDSVSFVSNIIQMIKMLLGTSESDQRIASGAAFVNSASNDDWQTYKYAQRYVSLARATASLRKYAGDSTAYNNIQFFEGSENPVVAFTREYYASQR